MIIMKKQSLITTKNIVGAITLLTGTGITISEYVQNREDKIRKESTREAVEIKKKYLNRLNELRQKEENEVTIARLENFEKGYNTAIRDFNMGIVADRCTGAFTMKVDGGEITNDVQSYQLKMNDEKTVVNVD
jgi:hypothetical protein